MQHHHTDRMRSSAVDPWHRALSTATPRAAVAAIERDLGCPCDTTDESSIALKLPWPFAHSRPATSPDVPKTLRSRQHREIVIDKCKTATNAGHLPGWTTFPVSGGPADGRSGTCEGSVVLPPAQLLGRGRWSRGRPAAASRGAQRLLKALPVGQMIPCGRRAGESSCASASWSTRGPAAVARALSSTIWDAGRRRWPMLRGATK